MRLVKENLKLILTILSLVFIALLNYVKFNYFNLEFNLIEFCVKNILLILISIICNIQYLIFIV